MEMSPEDKLEMKNALDGKLSDDYKTLEKVLEHLTTAKEAASNHGTFKRIDGAMSKVRVKMSRLNQ